MRSATPSVVFETGSLRDRAEELLGILGYESERFEEDFDFGPDEFLEWADKETPDRKNRQEAAGADPGKLEDRIAKWSFSTRMTSLDRQADLFGRDTPRMGEEPRAKSFLFLGVDLKDGDHATPQAGRDDTSHQSHVDDARHRLLPVSPPTTDPRPLRWQ